MAEAGKTALVTGGAKRVGRAIVLDLAQAGFSVAIHCNSSTREADALAEEIRQAGGKAAVVQAELTDMAQVDKLVAKASSALGEISVLVNNASVFEDDSLTNFDWEGWDRHFAIHLKAPVLLARRFAETLPKGQEGLIVNIIDQRVWKPTPRYFSYGLSKSSLWDATKIMAQSLGPNIRVNAIGPGPTLMNARQNEEDFAAQVDSLLLKRGPDLSEFGATIRYLWDARSVTGQMIALDGGQHLAWETPDVTGMVE